ncbi:MAG: DUF4349 domain-containing protein, partial [Pseudomonadota bacterium]
MFRRQIVAVAALLLAACGGGDSPRSEVTEGEFAPPPVASAELQAQDFGGLAERSRSEPTPEPIDGGAEAGAGEQYIAYSHNLGLRLPLEGVEPVMQGHVEACQAAGTDTCIVINSNLNKQTDEYTSGYLSLRAEPDWIETFLAGVDETAENAGGEVSQRSSSAEDLTRTILDADARLKAQITLQGRLEDLLANRDGELS